MLYRHDKKVDCVSGMTTIHHCGRRKGGALERNIGYKIGVALLVFIVIFSNWLQLYHDYETPLDCKGGKNYWL